MTIIKKLFYLLTSSERKKINLLFLMIILMALIDMIGVASIMPFIAVLSNPEMIETNSQLNFLFEYSGKFGIETTQQFFLFLGIIFFTLLVFSLSFKALTTYVQFRFIQMREFTIGKRLIESYLNQPYSWFLSRHSADLGKTVLSEVRTVVSNGISPLINLIANIVVAIVLLSLLIFVNPKLAIIAGLVLGLVYALLYKIVRGFVNKIGLENVKADRSRFTTASEAFGASKEIKLGGLEKIYTERFAIPAKKFAYNFALLRIIAQAPRFALEAIAFGGLLLVILNLISKGDTLNAVLPIIALYAFAGYRLMPALQQIYHSFTLLRFVGPALDHLYDDFHKLEKDVLADDKNKLSLNNQIILNNANYNYPNTSKNVLKNINISISAHKSIGIVGKTGSGKTTLIDIIIGLLDVQEGVLKVDDQVITKNNQRSWQKSIGYVPQKIFLADDTIEANIAFGTDFKNIDHDKVIRASKIANLHEFVSNELPNKYQTKVGERGVRLSGGQSQRIGIARALYNETSLLVLDEATSALDYQTEKAVMQALRNASKEITIIIIAHRLNTIKGCDKIFFLEDGEIKGEGNYDELVESNVSFKKFISIN